MAFQANRIAFLGLLIAAMALAASAQAGQVVDEVVIELVPWAEIEDVVDDHETFVLGAIPDRNLYLIGVPHFEGDGDDDDGDADAEEWVEENLAGDPRISAVDFNYEGDAPEEYDPSGGTQGFFFDAIESDFYGQYAWPMVGLSAAHTESTGDSTVVALLDTGVDPDHPLMSEVLLGDGFNFVDGTEDTASGDGPLAAHGTFMAGVIARVAPQSAILPVKVLDDEAQGTAFWLTQGIYFAISENADIINLSLGAEEAPWYVEDALDYARASGVLVVAAAGNCNESTLLQPAADAAVIGVVAVDVHDTKSTFSNYGETAVLAAPGSDIVSSVLGIDYGRTDGTSIAAAFVSGSLALITSRWPELPAAAVEARLRTTAVSLDAGNPDYAGMLGDGRIDLAAALDADPPDADITGDGVVDYMDFIALVSAWGPCHGDTGSLPEEGCPADLDGSGEVDLIDMFALLSMMFGPMP